jgi:hypothetical protein
MAIELIPRELAELKLWLQYYPKPGKPGKKPTKHPCVKYAAPEHKANLRTLAGLKDRPLAKGGGFQILVDKTAGYIFVDLDKCRNPETADITAEAQAIVDRMQTYTEVSPSGTGLRLVCKGTLPADFHVEGNPVEIYAGNIPNKLMAMTGNVLGLEFMEVQDRQPEAAALLKKCQESVGVKAAMQETITDAAVDALLTAKEEPGGDENAPCIVVREGHLDIVEMASEKMEIYDMPRDVLCGRLVEIYDEYLSAFPRAYAYPALLAAAAVKIPRSGFRTNLYGCAVGPIRSGKSQSFEQAAQLFRLEKPVLTRVKAGSMEGLVSRLSDAEGADRIVFVNELGYLLEKANIEHASYSFILNDAFYDDDIELVVAGRKAVNANVRLSIFGGVPEETFGDLFRQNSLGGLYDRFIFGLSPKPFTYLYRPLEAAPVELEPVAVSVARDVYDERDEWIKRNVIANPRTAEIAIRTAVICASLDGRSTLDRESLGPALRWAMYQQEIQETLLPNPGRNQNAEAENRIRNVIRNHTKPGQWLSAREIEQYGSIKRDYGTQVLESVLAAMRRAGEIEYMEVTSPKNGKVKRLVKLKEQGDEAK